MQDQANSKTGEGAASSVALDPAAPVCVLIVQDDDTETRHFRDTLAAIESETFEVTDVSTLKDGLCLLGSGRFDIAFVADRVGDEAGIELIGKAGGRLSPTPMVLRAGATDVLDRDEMSPGVLRRVIRYARFHHDTTRRLVVGEQRYREQAEHASQASGEKSKFLAHMSHELRTPLNAILGFSEVIQKEIFGGIEGGGAGKYREYIDHINASGGHLLSLINDLLDLSKIEAGKLETDPADVPLAEIAGDVARMTMPQARAADVSVTLSMPDRNLQIYADRRLITQAILNIVSNAVKFSPTGATVDLDVRLEGQNIVISVEDQGAGMTADERRQALEPFLQVGDLDKRSERGTGLGLPLARSILELHQGGLEIASEPGAGTTVSMWLPRRIRTPQAVSAEM